MKQSKQLLKILLMVVLLLCQIAPKHVSAYTLGDKDFRRRSSEKIIGEKISVKYDDGQFENIGTYSYTYDSAGRIFIDSSGYHFYDNYDHEILTHFSEYYYVSMGNEYQYKRNPDGLLTEIYHAGETTAQEVFTYDPFGNIVKSEYQFNAEKNQYTYLTTYTYGRNYQLDSIQTVNQLTNQVSEEYTLTYRADGNLSKVVSSYYHEDGSKETREESYSYGGNYLARIEVRDPDTGDSKGESGYYYDSNYKLIRCENHQIYGQNEEWATLVTEYQYASGDSATTEKPEVTKIYPESGMSGQKMYNRLDIDFNLEIESLNLSSGTFYLVNNADDTDYVALTSSSSCSYDGNHLVLLFSDSYNYKDKATYHLEMDNHVIKFKNSLDSFEIVDNSVWEYTVDSESYGGADRLVKEGLFKYYAGSLDSRSSTANYSYNDRWFDNSAYDFNSNLALMSLCMSMAAFGAESSDPAENITALLTELEFEHITVTDGYKQSGNNDSIGAVFASKQLDGDVTLINISLRGDNYDQEVYSNYRLGEESSLHEGFDKAKEKVLSDLMTYLLHGEGAELRGTLYFWIQGYGRAGSVANLLGKALDEGVSMPNGLKFQNRKTFIYCFEPYRTATNEQVGDSAYANIFNLISLQGATNRFPMNEWGYSRYGVEVYLPVKGLDQNYALFSREVLSQLNTLRNTNTESLHMNRQLSLLAHTMKHVLQHIPDVTAYNEQYQKRLIEDYAAPDSFDDRVRTLRSQLFYICYGIKVTDSFVEKLKGITSGNEEINLLNQLSTLMRSSSPEMFYSWLTVLNRSEDAQPLRSESSSHNLKLHRNMALLETVIDASVDVELYEGETLLAQVKDGVLENRDTLRTDAEVTPDGKCIFVTPNYAELRFEIKGKNTNDMRIRLIQRDVVSKATLVTVAYDNVELKEGTRFTLEVYNADDSTLRYALKDSLGAEVNGAEVSSEEAESAEVKVSLTGNGIIFGEGVYDVNSICTLTAVPLDSYSFAGWYDGERALSNMAEFSFEISKDVNYTARFELEEAKEESNKNGAFIKLVLGIVAGSLTLYLLAFIFSRFRRNRRNRNHNDIIPR